MTVFQKTTPIHSDWTGRSLQAALTEQPSLQLSLYSFGAILGKATDNGGFTEFPVDPDEIARALSAKTIFTTGLMTEDVLYVHQEGVKQTVVGFRKRQRTGIWLEGSDEPLRVPLPDLILIRTLTDGNTPSYQVFATKGRPEALDASLFNVPLPNIYGSGQICWGNVRLDGLTTGTSLTAGWNNLLGTRFGSHSVGGKSKTHHDDVRKILIDLNTNPRRRVYPRSDLIPAKKTLAQVLGIEEANA
ncbi:MAG: hypothetical protein H6670_11045 [Anaerolineaceae bacterium]|nr:hypothetical protein [Anaerolineaceae bacterium]